MAAKVFLVRQRDCDGRRRRGAQARAELPQAHAAELNRTQTRVFSLGGGWNLDAQDPSQSNWTRFINHSAVAPNVRACVRRDADVLFVLLHRDGVGADDDDGDDDDTAAWRDLEVDGARVELWTTRAVCAGDELLLNYGPEFAAWIARRAAAQQDARRDRAGTTTGGDVPDLDVADAGLF